jgi:hypothetical protein
MEKQDDLKKELLQCPQDMQLEEEKDNYIKLLMEYCKMPIIDVSFIG